MYEAQIKSVFTSMMVSDPKNSSDGEFYLLGLRKEIKLILAKLEGEMKHCFWCSNTFRETPLSFLVE